MAWRLAKALDKLRAEANAKWPDRAKGSDGTIGDANHSSRSSDHNPNSAGVVCAMDITHDPKSGCDSYALAEFLREGKDGRIKYIISNRKICSGTNQGNAPWVWRPYKGANPHDHHVHVSVKSNAANYDSAASWGLAKTEIEVVDTYPVETRPVLRVGSTGDDVKMLQSILGIRVDGIFGTVTREAVAKFQHKWKVTADSIVGPQTWNLLIPPKDKQP